MVLGINPGISLVTALEDAVVGGWNKRHVVGERAIRIIAGRTEYRRRAGVDKSLHAALRLADRLEHRQRAEHVNLGAEQRIGAAHGDLQTGEVNELRDAVLVDGAA